MSPNVELRQQRKAIAVQMDALCSEFAGKKTPTEQEQREFNEKFDRMDADQKSLLASITRMEASDAINAEVRGVNHPPQADPSGVRRSADEIQERNAKYHAAWSRMMFKPGRSEEARYRMLSDEDRAILDSPEFRSTIGVEGTPAGGAYPGSTAGLVVPVGFIAEVESALKYYGPMLDGGPRMPKIIVTETGGQLPFPTSNDTTQTGEIITEGSSLDVQDVATGIMNLQSYKFSSKVVKVSWEMLQDAAINIPDFLSQRFAERLGRILNTKFTLGAGTTEPTGVVTQSTQAQLAGSGYTALGSSSNDGTSAGGNTIGSDDLVTLEHSVDPLYRRQAAYMFHDSTLAALKRVKDKYGRPLWLPGMADHEPDTINGFPYKINNDMATLQAAAASPTVSSKTVLFGDLTKYIIRRVRDITIMRFDELYAGNGQVGFTAYARYDANLLDAGTHPVQYLVNTF